MIATMERCYQADAAEPDRRIRRKEIKATYPTAEATATSKGIRTCHCF
ncbi:MAG: hypothetical protein ACLR2O_09420 [Coprococcus sp.]